MRIALLSDTVYPTPLAYGHGVGRAVFNLGRELLHRGHDVTLLGGEGSALNGARVITTNDCRTSGELDLRDAVLERLGEFDIFIDSTHTHALANAECALPGIAWFHDCAMTQAPCGVFVSKWARAEVGQPGEVIYNAIVPEEFPLYIGPREGLLWMALNVPIKGLHIAKVVARRSGMQLTARGMETPDGPLSGDKKIAALQHARAYLFPSTIDAGPLTPLEAMACGTPCIALQIAGTMEYIQHDVNGFLCKTETEMVMAVLQGVDKLDAGAIRQSIIDGGFVVPRQASEFEHLLEQVLKGERW